MELQLYIDIICGTANYAIIHKADVREVLTTLIN